MTSDSREVRECAREVKFIVDSSTATAVRAWARSVLLPDEHGAGDFGDEYWTTSLYFDTEDGAVLRRQGSFGRAKYRVRRYGDDDMAFLERKLRTPNMLSKRRTRLPLSEVSRLYEHGFSDWSGHWFKRRLMVRQLTPTCVVRYHRTARLLPTPSGVARLTLDDSITAATPAEFGLAAASGIPVLAEFVLELKFKSVVPSLFRELVEMLALSPGRVSKYRLSMSAMGHERLMNMDGQRHAGAPSL